MEKHSKAVPAHEEPLHKTVFQNQHVRVFYVIIPPRGDTLLHHHAHPYVTIAVGDAEISNEVEGDAAKTLRLKDGEALSTGGGYAHIIRNLRDVPFVNVTIEFLDDAPKGR